jgi:DNA-directed RNA polymerase subunit RPC12/RpoP
MRSFICQTCGTQFAVREEPPAACPICYDRIYGARVRSGEPILDPNFCYQLALWGQKMYTSCTFFD